MGDVKATDIVDIIDGYKGRGYGLSTPEELGKPKSLFALLLYVCHRHHCVLNLHKLTLCLLLFQFNI